jgi:hypothetical protein
MAEQLARTVLAVMIGEQRRGAIERPQAGVNVARRSDVGHGRLGHERDRTTERRGDLFGGVLVDVIAIGHLECGGVRQIDLVLASAGLTLGEFNGNSRTFERATNLSDDVFVAGGLQDVVVLREIGVRAQGGVPARVGLFVRVAVQIELDLATDHGQETHRCRGFHLAPKNGARSDLHQLTGLGGKQIAHDQCGAGHPRKHTHGVPVGARDHVAVPLVEAGESEARGGVVLDVAGEQVVAVLGAVIGHVIHEESTRGAFAHQTTVTIDEPHDHRIDDTLVDEGPQFVTRHHRSGQHGVTLPSAVPATSS